LGVPKFIQFSEAVKEGGGKWRRKKEVQGKEVNEQIQEGSGDSSTGDDVGSDSGEEIGTMVPMTLEGGVLEIVLPSVNPSPPSGVNLLLCDGSFQEGANTGTDYQHLEAAKLLQIQKNVGFCYEVHDSVAVKELIIDEVRDRSKKQEWEQREVPQ
jgi:hypothetical protein